MRRLARVVLPCQKDIPEISPVLQSLQTVWENMDGCGIPQKARMLLLYDSKVHWRWLILSFHGIDFGEAC